MAVLALAAGLRLYGRDWDDGQWLHPDERQIYFVTQSLDWPRSVGEALSPNSPLNPHFFAYGSLPLYLLKLFAVLLAPMWPALRDPDMLHLAGRTLAVLFDLGTVFLTYRLALAVYPGGQSRADARSCLIARRQAVVAALLASVAVVAVQLAHFYTVDTVLCFFVTLVLNLVTALIRGGPTPRTWCLLGISLGLAMATKISAAPLVLAVVAGIHATVPAESPGGLGRFALISIVRHTLVVLAIAAAAFLIVQPYAAIDLRSYLGDLVRESKIAWGRLDVPYTRQFAGTWPILYSAWQLTLWGLGLPLGIVGWVGLVVALRRWLRDGNWTDTVLLTWVVPYLVMVGLMRARYLRYMLPLVPVVCVFAAQIIVDLRRQYVRVASYLLVVAPTLVYSLAFVSIYAWPHSWVAASRWVYQTVEPGRTLSVEVWDTALPLPLELEGRSRRISEYDVRTLELYEEPDDATKWSQIAQQLADSDYLIIASRRLLGSIPRLPDRYPIAGAYHEQLLSGRLGFELVAEFSRGASWWNPRVAPLAGASPAWRWPDESFVVYDHPRVLVLGNAGRLPAGELYQILTAD